MSKDKCIVAACAFAIICWILLGVGLYFAIPAFDRMYSDIYTNWPFANSLSARMFSWPSFIWLLLSTIPIALTFYFSKKYQGKRRLGVAIVSFLMCLIAYALALNWIYGFVFVHEWGTSRIFGPFI